MSPFKPFSGKKRAVFELKKTSNRAKNAFLSIPDLQNSFPESAEKSRFFDHCDPFWAHTQPALKSLRSRLNCRGPKAVVQSHLGVLSPCKFWASETQFSSSYEVHVTCSGSGSGSGFAPMGDKWTSAQRVRRSFSRSLQ